MKLLTLSLTKDQVINLMNKDLEFRKLIAEVAFDLLPDANSHLSAVEKEASRIVEVEHDARQTVQPACRISAIKALRSWAGKNPDKVPSHMKGDTGVMSLVAAKTLIEKFWPKTRP